MMKRQIVGERLSATLASPKQHFFFAWLENLKR